MNLRIYAGLSHACEAVVRQRRKIARHGRRPRGRKMKITKIRIPSSVRTRIWPFIWAVSHSRAAKFIVPELLCAISCHTHTYTLRHHKKKTALVQLNDERASPSAMSFSVCNATHWFRPTTARDRKNKFYLCLFVARRVEFKTEIVN